MDPARSASICRQFLSGTCRLGPRCNYRHEWPFGPSTQICRYHQKGGCWYGERCRYLHVRPHEADAAAARWRGSVPAISSPHFSSSSSSGTAFASADRRASEPALPQTALMSRQERSTSTPLVNVPNPQRNPMAAYISEDQSKDTHSPPTASGQSAHAHASDGEDEQVTSSHDVTTDEDDDGGAAAAAGGAAGGAAAAAGGATAAAAVTASSSQDTAANSEAYVQSRNVTCGICMDKVYEKPEARHQIFGLLPNCNHSFCLQCIRTWRKTKDLEPDVTKSCPQCRVKSAFYVPSKYWVEGEAKEKVITAFKEKFSKKHCNYYARYRYCPFKTECLYQHEKHARRSHMNPTEDEFEDLDLFNVFITTTFLSVDDDLYDDLDGIVFAFYLSDEFPL